MGFSLPYLAVLVVDDDDVAREKVLRLLRRAPFGVDAVEAGSAAQALELVRARRFDCIVLDNRLGDATGVELLPVLQRESHQACPVIMVTGEGDERLAVQMLQNGAADYVPKRQLSADVLCDAIQRSIDQQQLKAQHDAQQRHLADQARAQAFTLEQRDHDLKSILDHLPALVSYWDLRSHNRFGNFAYEQWFGITPERIAGMHLRDVIGARCHAICAPHVEAALRGAEQMFEYVADAPAGQSPRHCQAHYIPDRAPDGRIGGFYSFTTDVTPVREAQRRASELAIFNEVVIQSSPVGVAVYDADGRCMLANPALAQALGKSVDALLLEDFRRLDWWLASGLLVEAEATLADGLPRRCDALAPVGHCASACFECGLAAIDHQGERRLLLIAHDVTAERAAQAEMAAARDVAQAAALAKSSFLANMSHEIRTPMNAIVGLSRLALEDEMAARPRDFVEKVHSSALALMGILDDVLDYSKIEAGQLRFEAVEFDLDGLLQRVADLFGVRIAQKNLEFVFHVMPDVPTHLVGDPLRVAQVLNNLVGNAVKFTEHGVIEVTVGLLERHGAARCRLRFSVRDTGAGIPPEHQAGLFDAFTQADSSVTRRFGGSGLGLAICKRLVAQMGGAIGVDSRPGQGSEFHFTAELGIGEACVQAGDPLEVAGLHALVADDNPDCLRVLAHELEALQLRVTTAADGASALAQFDRALRQGKPFDVVLLDWKMPGIDGLETLRRLRERMADDARNPPPVMMMVTAFGRDTLLTAAGGMRPDHVLTKPILRTLLLEALLRLRKSPPTGVASGASALTQLRARAARLHGMQVLVVEDNAVNQLVAAEMLAMLGLEATVAPSGGDAVDAVRSAAAGRFDAVLMDLHMPEMDGFEATRRIHAIAHATALPVIAMSAAVLAEDRAASLAAGMVDHVGKPVSPEQLVEVLLRWIPQARHLGRTSDQDA
jgi:CheY-like chemotaxis protein